MKRLIFILVIIPFLGLSQTPELLGSVFSEQVNTSPPPTGETLTIVLNDLTVFPGAFGAAKDWRIDPAAATIFEVTNTNDSGAGSFRQAFEANSGPGGRIIIIKVEGIATTNNAFAEFGDSSGRLLVWGQFAPGFGLTLDHPRLTTTDGGNISFRFLTLQGRNALGCTVNVDCFDAMNNFRVPANTNIYHDHNTLRYSVDQTWTMNVNEFQSDIETINATFAYNLLAEADPAHSTGSIINVDVGGSAGVAVDFPNLNANGDYEKYNNYVLNYSARASRYNVTPNVDFHRNYYDRGNLTNGQAQRTNKLNQGNNWGSSEPSIYSAFNFFDGFETNVTDNLQSDAFQWFDVANGPVPVEFFTTTRQHNFGDPQDGLWDALDVPAKARASVGHNRGINTDGTPFYGYDSVDSDYIQKAATGNTNTTYRATSSWNNPTLPGTAIYTDTDGDNMPDWFEDQFAFLDKNNASDMLTTSNVTWDFSSIGAAHNYIVTNNAGYTNLEICAAFYAGDFEIMIDGTNNLNLNN